MADITSRGKRGLLVGGAVSLWILGLMWTLHRKGVIEIPTSDSDRELAVSDEPTPVARRPDGVAVAGEEPVSEITVDVGRSKRDSVTPVLVADPASAIVELEPPTYSVWFESERELGVCKVTYEGGSKTANLHVAARLPEGRLDFSYRCGKYSGRASIDVKPKRINGVLFCKDSGDVRVETVRTKDGRCASR